MWAVSLHNAARRGEEAALRALLAAMPAGAGVDARVWDEETALMAASWNGREPAVAVLLAAGAEPSLRNKYGRSALTYGEGLAAGSLPFGPGRAMPPLLEAYSGVSDWREVPVRHRVEVTLPRGFGVRASELRDAVDAALAGRFGVAVQWKSKEKCGGRVWLKAGEEEEARGKAERAAGRAAILTGLRGAERVRLRVWRDAG